MFLINPEIALYGQKNLRFEGAVLQQGSDAVADIYSDVIEGTLPRKLQQMWNYTLLALLLPPQSGGGCRGHRSTRRLCWPGLPAVVVVTASASCAWRTHLGDLSVQCNSDNSPAPNSLLSLNLCSCFCFSPLFLVLVPFWCCSCFSGVWGVLCGCFVLFPPPPPPFAFPLPSLFSSFFFF